MGLDIFFTRKTSEEVGYFRKVNFLVSYFEQLGFDVENQIPFRIDKEDAENLLKLCNEVLEDNSKAYELLPTCAGFFFGSIAYDEYYFSDVKKVKEYIEETLLPTFDELEPYESIYFETWY